MKLWKKLKKSMFFYKPIRKPNEKERHLSIMLNKKHATLKTCSMGNKEEQSQEKAFIIDDDDSDNNSDPDEQDKEYKAIDLQLINI